MSINPFTVLTEFRFDIGSAVASSKTLQGAVEGISGAANDTLLNFQRMSTGIVGYMGLGSGGIAGAFLAAIQASDKFAQSQRDFTNIIMSNVSGVGTFKDVMMSTETIMGNINKKAQEFSLPSTDLLSMTKIIGATLISHNLDDTSFTKSIDLSRQFLKSAPTLGIDPTLAQGQLLDTVQGRASLGDTLFQRLTNETQAMKPYATSQSFNALDPAKRLDVLTKALAQFSSNLDVVRGNAMSLSGEMRRLGELIKGPFSILRGIGDALLQKILPAFHAVNNYLQTQGKQIFDSFGFMIKNLVTDVPGFIATLIQLRDLSKDLKSAAGILGVVGALVLMAEVLTFLGIQIPFVTAALVAFRAGIKYLEADLLGGALGSGLLRGVFGSGMFGTFMVIVDKIVIFVSSIIVPLLLLVGVFQLFSRAIAYAKIFAAQNLLEFTPAITKALAGISYSFGYFMKGFDTIAKGLGYLLDPTKFLGFINLVSIFADMLTWASDKLVQFLAGFQGLFFAISQLIINVANDMAEVFGLGKNKFGQTVEVGQAFDAGINDVLSGYFNRQESSGSGIMNNVTNIDKVEINNAFKEQMEPDRIAFALRDQLLKAATNPRESSGRSLSAAFASGK